MKKVHKALIEVWEAQERLFEKAKSLGCAFDITEYMKFVRKKASLAHKNSDILLTDEDTRIPGRIKEAHLGLERYGSGERNYAER